MIVEQSIKDPKIKEGAELILIHANLWPKEVSKTWENLDSDSQTKISEVISKFLIEHQCSF